MMLYATQFISLATLDYRAVCWRLFHSPSSSSWPNMLPLSRMLFSLPVSNGKLERIFSVLKLIKVDRSSLGNDTLKDLLTLNTDGRSMDNFNPDPSLIYGGKLKHENQTRRRKKCTRGEQKKLLNQKLTVAVMMMTHFCWMTGIIGWMIIDSEVRLTCVM